ncbi:MAG: hypothetical protein V7723_02515 [Sneathiella sp.]|uniref:hypothetical protein n=1 Tax=Sneathiella sp. TaxID=1964365 RepID=UPI0030016FDF
MSFVIALIFVFNIFAIVPLSESHSKDSDISHFMVSAMDDMSERPDKMRHDHIEKCGVASCSIAVPDFSSATSAVFGQKTSFSVSTTQLGSLHVIPPDRPPRT